MITSLRSRVFWIAAVAMLLLTGIELIACEVISPETCELAGTAGEQSGDACLCCCSHIAVAPPLVLEPAKEAVVLDPAPAVAFLPFEKASIFHPPKA